MSYLTTKVSQLCYFAELASALHGVFVYIVLAEISAFTNWYFLHLCV